MLQQDIFKTVSRICEEMKLDLILADPVSSPRPVFWVLGPKERQHDLIRLCENEGLKTLLTARSKRRQAEDSLDENLLPRAFIKPLRKEGYVVHGRPSGIVLDFCHFEDERGVWVPESISFDSMLPIDAISSLPKANFLGCKLRILPNAEKIFKTHPESEPIDVVYTWVNGQDIKWITKKNHTISGEFGPEVDGPARYVSGKELEYSIKSILRYFTNLGKIYIVTDDQIPDQIGDLLNNVQIIDHKDIFPKNSALPNFNSHAIGGALHNIDGLSERYLYFNDDVILGAPACSSLFFSELGQPKHFPSNRSVLCPRFTGVEDRIVDIARRNVQTALSNELGYFAWKVFRHAPVATQRSLMAEVEKRFPSAWSQTMANSIRDANDFPLAGFLYQHYAIALGRSQPGSLNYRYFLLNSADFQKKFFACDWRIAEGRPSVFCISSSEHDKIYHVNLALLEDTLDKVFP